MDYQNVFVEVETLYSRMEDSAKDLLKGTPATNLKSTHLSVLDSLYTEDGQMASQLAKSVGRAATSFTPILDEMVKHELVERRPHPKDRRAIRVYLTAKGESLKLPVQDTLSKVRMAFAGFEIHTP